VGATSLRIASRDTGANRLLAVGLAQHPTRTARSVRSSSQSIRSSAKLRVSASLHLHHQDWGSNGHHPPCTFWKSDRRHASSSGPAMGLSGTLSADREDAGVSRRPLTYRARSVTRRTHRTPARLPPSSTDLDRLQVVSAPSAFAVGPRRRPHEPRSTSDIPQAASAVHRARGPSTLSTRRHRRRGTRRPCLCTAPVLGRTGYPSSTT
jgi:hypothetical protein